MSKEFNLRWYGNLTVDNIEKVAGLFLEMLDGKRYTFVASGATYHRPDVRTGQKLEPSKTTSGNALNVWFDKENSPPQYAGFNFVDTYGVWGLSTSAGDQPYISFEWNKVTIEHKNGFGETLIWVIAVE